MLKVTVARSGVVDDEYTLAAGFQWVADNGFERYLVVSASKQVEQQDIDLGHTGLHVELDDQSNSAYRAVEAIKLGRAHIVEISLSPQGRRVAGTDRIVLSTTEADAEALTMLRQLAATARVVLEEF